MKWESVLEDKLGEETFSRCTCLPTRAVLADFITTTVSIRVSLKETHSTSPQNHRTEDCLIAPGTNAPALWSHGVTNMIIAKVNTEEDENLYPRD